eukprot:67191_1
MKLSIVTVIIPIFVVSMLAGVVVKTHQKKALELPVDEATPEPSLLPRTLVELVQKDASPSLEDESLADPEDRFHRHLSKGSKSSRSKSSKGSRRLDMDTEGEIEDELEDESEGR